MRSVKEVHEKVLVDKAEFREIRLEGESSKDPSPRQVKGVRLNGRRYIVCLNSKQAMMDRADREAIVASLEEQLKTGKAFSLRSETISLGESSRSRTNFSIL